MTNQLLFGVVVVPAVVGLTQCLKQAGMPSAFAPIAAVLFGVLAGLAQLEAGRITWIPAVVIGISLGLSAVGLYAGASSLIGAASAPKPVDAAAAGTTAKT